MKKLIILLFTLFLTIWFSACSSLSNNVNTDSKPTIPQITQTHSPTTNITNTFPEQEAFSFQIFETGVFDNYSGANHQIDIELKKTQKIDANAEQQVTFSFDDVDYCLPYVHTEVGYLYNANYDVYIKVEKGKSYIEIRVNQNSKRIDKFEYCDWLYLQHLDDSAREFNRDECLMIARVFINQYISDFDIYQLYDEDCYISDYFGLTYQFHFFRYIGDFQTSDQVAVWITAYGDIVLYDLRGLGDMQGAELPTDEEMSQIQVGLDAKVLEICQRLEERYTVEHYIDKVQFIRLSDGRYAFKYRVGARLTPKGDGVPYSECFDLLVIIDE